MRRTSLRSTCVWIGCVGLTLLAGGFGLPPAATAASDCTVSAYNNQTVDGTTMWVDVTTNVADQNCELDQLAWNNFLYLVTNDSSGNPRFMSFAPWYDVFPSSGSPTWPGTYTPLNSTQINKNHAQAGDGFHLLDITGAEVGYDMRVNEAYYNYINTTGLYTKAKLNEYIANFNADPSTGGVWFPAGDSSTPEVGAIEIKTAWRDFGSDSQACPSDLMHCEQDSSGNSWGLVGFHLVQKTPTHGEFVWMSFEHVANSPDCSTGGSNPLQQNPTDPTGSSSTINVNKNLSQWSSQTGWSFFDYTSYKAQGGDGSTCPYSKLVSGTESTCEGSSSALCLTDPNPSGDGSTFVPVNVCRTDSISPGTTGCTSPSSNNDLVGCLNNSVLANFPAQVDSKWRYYMLIGIEWLVNGATGLGAPTTGCISLDDGPGTSPNTEFGYTCPTSTSDGVGEVERYTPAGTTSMANTTLETWMQKGSCLTTANNQTWVGQDCFSCHQPPTLSYQGDFSHLLGRITQAGSSAAILQEKAAAAAASAATTPGGSH